MDYESRRVKWYWLLLFILYSGAVAYLLFSGNPYLYSQQELRAALVAGANNEIQTIPSEPKGPAKLGAPTYFSRYGSGHTGVDPVSTTRSRSLIEFEKNEIQTGVPNFKLENVAFDSSGYYLSGAKVWLVAVGLDGKSRWRYRFLNPGAGDKGLFPPLLDENSAYAVHPSGETVALDKASGELRWVLPYQGELVANPFLWGNAIVLPVKEKARVQLMLINRSTGKILAESPTLDLKPGFQVSRASTGKDLIITVDNKVVAIDTDQWEISWTQTLTEPVRPPAVAVDNQIFVATLGAKLIKIDGGRKGKIDWEIELDKPAAAPPTYLPIMARLSFVDTAGALVTVDAKSGKIYWRYGIDAASNLTDTWSSRLSARHIDENKMDWLHKGWTIWSPCGRTRACIYTPLKGQLIQRIDLAGEPIGLPLLLEKRMVFLTEPQPGKYLLTHQVEEAEVRRLRKEAAESAAN